MAGGECSHHCAIPAPLDTQSQNGAKKMADRPVRRILKHVVKHFDNPSHRQWQVMRVAPDIFNDLSSML